MPTGTSSAVPAALDVLGHEAVSGALRVIGAADHLHDALVGYARSGTDAPGVSLLLTAPDVSLSAMRTIAWGDAVRDLAAAFAVAGAGVAMAGAVGTAVSVADGAVADLLALPGGRVHTVEELAAMGPRQVRAWFDELLALPGFEDPNFRAVQGLLRAAERGFETAGVFSIFSDPGFDLADAAVLASMRDAWLVWRGIAPPDPLPLAPEPAGTPSPGRDTAAEARLVAVAAWVSWFESSPGLPEDERDEAWATAEEHSVRAAERLLAEQGTGFGPGMMVLVPFTHTFRAAVATDREGELVRSLLGTVDLEPLKDRAGTVAAAWVAAAGRDAERASRTGLERLEELVPDPFDFLLAPVRAQVATIEESARLAGAAVDTATDVVPLSINGLGPAELLDRVGLGDDLQAITEALVDPSATPPDLVQRFLDDVIGEPAPYPDAAGAYYLARLTDLGYLPGLSTGRPIPGAVPSIPTS